MKQFRKLFVVAGVLLFLGGVSFADKKLEYSRITRGGSQSSAGRFQVNDSITENTGGRVQKGSRFTVTSAKARTRADTTAVKKWGDYK
jgi:hypothetical protein